MTAFIYDNSWPGFLTAVFDAYRQNCSAVRIIKESRYQPALLEQPVQVITDRNRAGRVWAGLNRKISPEAAMQLYAAFLSETSGIEQVLHRYIRLVFTSPVSPEKAFGQEDVLKVSQISRMVHREKHRMEAFVRFKLLPDGLFYSVISPDFNVLPLILDHFRKRYADQRWLIIDLKRKYGIYYNLRDVEEVVPDFNPEAKGAVFHDSEKLYQELWKDYFYHVNISERKNTPLHVRHVPRRYWKYLTEKS